MRGNRDDLPSWRGGGAVKIHGLFQEGLRASIQVKPSPLDFEFLECLQLNSEKYCPRIHPGFAKIPQRNDLFNSAASGEGLKGVLTRPAASAGPDVDRSGATKSDWMLGHRAQPDRLGQNVGQPR